MNITERSGVLVKTTLEWCEHDREKWDVGENRLRVVKMADRSGVLVRTNLDEF